MPQHHNFHFLKWAVPCAAWSSPNGHGISMTYYTCVKHMSKWNALFALGKAFAISFIKRGRSKSMIALHLMTFSSNLEFICKSEKWSLIITCPVTAAAQKVAFPCTWEGNQAAAFWCNSCWSCLFPLSSSLQSFFHSTCEMPAAALESVTTGWSLSQMHLGTSAIMQAVIH